MQPIKSEGISKMNSNFGMDVGKSHPSTNKQGSEEIKKVLIIYASGSVGANDDLQIT